MRRFALALMLVCASFGVRAEIAAGTENSTFVLALRAYEAGAFERAASLFEATLALEPECARCAHLLGKSYGRQAEQASWSRAVALARKTRDALELAVELAPDDAEAVQDLIRYYRAAPAFLGGGADKAEALEQRLKSSAADHTS